MKSMLIPAAALMILAGLSACSNKSQQPTASALDVSAPATPASTYTPAPASPVLAAPDPVYSQTPAAGNGNYTVKKGDTLYRIAKDHYGDGKQWQRIAAANPGVSPQSLRVGQTLVIP